MTTPTAGSDGAYLIVLPDPGNSQNGGLSDVSLVIITGPPGSTESRRLWTKRRARRRALQPQSSVKLRFGRVLRRSKPRCKTTPDPITSPEIGR